MLFHTPLFFAFFFVFFLFYWASRSNLKIQNTLILIASYVFYGSWDYRFLVLIIISSVTDYLAAIGCYEGALSRKTFQKPILLLAISSIALLSFEFSANLNFILLVVFYAIGLFVILLFLEIKGQASPKIFLYLSIVVNLGLLCVFKYFNFFADSLVDLVSLAGISLSYATLNIVLPVGISFYTFQTMSYTIDVYNKKLKPSHSLIDVSAYVAFFPQLVAGPIERGAHLLPQFLKKRTITWENARSGVYLFIWGMFKKAVVADNLALIADPIFSDPSGLTSGELLVALLAFTFQIYCDFSGYSDMARGVARVMGFNLMINFNVPYVSLTPSEFWRRWHISLSSWLRDYLYIALGGNRGGKASTYRNLFLTMLLGGLWHGASWTFVAWGVTHGLVLILYRLLNIDSWLKSRNDSNGVLIYVQNALLFLLMFSITTFTWLLFRAENFNIVNQFLIGLATFNNFLSGDWLILLGFISPLIAHDAWQVYKKDGEFIQDLPILLRVNVVLTIMCSYFFLQPGTEVAFLYFDF